MITSWWLQDDFRMTSGWLREQESNQTLSYRRSLKYFVLLEIILENPLLLWLQLPTRHLKTQMTRSQKWTPHYPELAWSSSSKASAHQPSPCPVSQNPFRSLPDAFRHPLGNPGHSRNIRPIIFKIPGLKFTYYLNGTNLFAPKLVLLLKFFCHTWKCSDTLYTAPHR